MAKSWTDEEGQSDSIQRSQISALKRQRWWDIYESEASLVYIVRVCLKKKLKRKSPTQPNNRTGGGEAYFAHIFQTSIGRKRDRLFLGLSDKSGKQDRKQEALSGQEVRTCHLYMQHIHQSPACEGPRA